MRDKAVIPAKAGFSQPEVSACLHDWGSAGCPAARSHAGGMAASPIPAWAGVTVRS